MFGARRLLQGVLVVVALWVFLTPTALAQETPNATDDIRGPQYTIDEMAEYSAAIQDCSSPSLECLVRYVNRFTAIEWTGDVMGGKICAADDAECTVPLGYNPGAVGGIAALITSMYQRPIANTSTYVAYVLDSANIAPPAYAQGLGFAALDPILSLWTTFRNIAYMFFVIIFIVIGFLIMFRQKVGQAAVTAQQAIPQIIIALILVTFSYAIAGLLIDLMYVVMFLILGIFSPVFGGVNVVGYDIINLGGLLMGRVNLDFNYDLVSSALSGLDLGHGLAGLGALTLTIVLTIAILIGMIRLFFELLKSYATVMLAVVAAPIALMMGAIPGKSAVFTTWIKTIVGNLLPFPTVLMVVVMFFAFTQGAISTSGGGFMPPFLLNTGLGIGPTIVAVMGLAIILALPDIVKSIKEMVAPKNGFTDMIVKAGKDNFQAGWTGKTPYGKIPLGVSGKNITKLGYGAAASGIGAGAGAVIGGGISYQQGRGFGYGARKGAVVGAASPVIARVVPPLIKDAAGILRQEGTEMFVEEALGKTQDKMRRERGVIGRLGEVAYSIGQRRAARTQPQTTSAPPTTEDHGAREL